jgi:hypothetical protein
LKNDDYNSNDKDFENIPKIKSLIISDSIFSNTNNILSKATYINSFFINTGDNLEDGIFYNSYFNNSVFTKGIIKESFWKNGVFNGGLFYNSKSFDGLSNSNYPYYYSNRLKSYFRRGSGDNNRWSWENGIFNGGEFYKSDWENGVFNGGLFNFSKFYGGTFSGGNIGDKSGSSNDTQIYNGDILYTTVDNANLYSVDTSFKKDKPSKINWYNGVFNNGLFGSYADVTYTNASTSIVYNNLSTFYGCDYDTKLNTYLVNSWIPDIKYSYSDLSKGLTLSLNAEKRYTGNLFSTSNIISNTLLFYFSFQSIGDLMSSYGYYSSSPAKNLTAYTTNN